MKKIITALASAACLLCSTTSNAGLYKVDFNMTGFAYPSWYADLYGNIPGPTDPLVGSIIFTADSLLTPATSVVGIDLTIDGYRYTVDEVGTYNDDLRTYLFFGKLNGTRSITDTNDFYFDFRYNVAPKFVYAVPRLRGNWTSTTGSVEFTQLDAEVPEPGSLALLLAGAGGLGAMLRRRRRV
jgi:hypothetical protein